MIFSKMWYVQLSTLLMLCLVVVLQLWFIFYSGYSLIKVDPKNFLPDSVTKPLKIGVDKLIEKPDKANVQPPNPSTLRAINDKIPSLKQSTSTLLQTKPTLAPTAKKRSKLGEFLVKFPWKEAQTKVDSPAEDWYRQNLLDELQYHAYREPEVPISKSCNRPPLINEAQINCADYPMAFTPVKRTVPVKIAHAIQLGFDADTLEIHLNEIYDVVDYFFIIEAPRVHCKLLKKQLMWTVLSLQERFKKFRDKIVHFVLDDVDIAPLHWAKRNIWELEALQERARWNKIKQWNSITNALSADDIIGFGDADEIASRNNLQLLKYCNMKKTSLDIGIWFPSGRLDQAFASDFPVSRTGSNKYTLGDPSFFRWQDAMRVASPKFPNRKRGTSGSFLLGGVHLTHYTYLPSLLLKMLSASECSQTFQKLNAAVSDLVRTQSVETFENYIHKRLVGNRIHLLKDIKIDVSKIVYFPWFYACNKDRYPAWQGQHDTRT